MLIRDLTLTETKQVYQKHLKRDFPSGELKPFFAIEHHLKNDFYRAIGCFDNTGAGLGDLVAYAYFCGPLLGGLLLLDYFAVVPKRRGQGVGSRFLQDLQSGFAESGGLIVEVEQVAAASDDAERRVRRRRTKFYEAAGFVSTAVSGKIFGVEYDVLYRPIKQSLADDDLLEAVTDLYRQIVPKVLFKANVHLRRNDV